VHVCCVCECVFLFSPCSLKYPLLAQNTSTAGHSRRPTGPQRGRAGPQERAGGPIQVPKWLSMYQLYTQNRSNLRKTDTNEERSNEEEVGGMFCSPTTSSLFIYFACTHAVIKEGVIRHQIQIYIMRSMAINFFKLMLI